MTPTKALEKLLWWKDVKLAFQAKSVRYRTTMRGTTEAAFVVEEGSSFLLYDSGDYYFHPIEEVPTNVCEVAPEDIVERYEKIVSV